MTAPGHDSIPTRDTGYVALDLGFEQPSHFCRRFKNFNRMTPSEFVGLYSAAGLE